MNPFIIIDLHPLLQIEEGHPAPLELDLMYEGFQEGSDAARPVEEVSQTIHQPGSLPRITHLPQVLENLPSPSKRQKIHIRWQERMIL